MNLSIYLMTLICYIKNINYSKTCLNVERSLLMPERRNYGIELLRIISMMMIIYLHLIG